MSTDGTKKPLVIYHSECVDGIIAAWAVEHSSPGNFDYHCAVYQTAPPDVSGRDVYLVDFSYKSPIIIEMAQTAYQITVIDHHDGAWNDLSNVMLPQNVKLHFAKNKSGAMLAWEFFNGFETKPPLSVVHAQDHDLWVFKHAFSFDFVSGFVGRGGILPDYRRTFQLLDVLYAEELAGNSNLINEIYREGKTLNQYRRNQINTLIELGKRYGTVGGYKVPICNAPHAFASEIGNILAKGESFAVTYTDEKTERRYSLRSSKDGVNVIKIAEQYGGSGHEHAAGFRIPFDHPLVLTDHGNNGIVRMNVSFVE